jgi:hypothetical protein
MCRFNIQFQGRPVAVLEGAEEAIKSSGGSFRVSDSKALFSVRTPVGRVEGTCKMVDPSTVAIAITKKPFFVPCSAIKKRVVAAFVAASKSSVAMEQAEK